MWPRRRRTGREEDVAKATEDGTGRGCGQGDGGRDGVAYYTETQCLLYMLV